MNKTVKYFLYIFIPSAIAFFLFFTYFYFSEVKKKNDVHLINETLNIQMGKKAIELEFQTVLSDLLILAKHNAFYNTRKLLPLSAYKNLQGDFSLFSEMKGIYDQIRFLNLDGMEIVRVNYNNGEIFTVPLKSLQNKGSRYYFKKSFKIAQGVIYVSPLDLNKERGEIEIPYKPMIRFGTPVFNAEKEKIGIVLLNFLAESLLVNFSNAVTNIKDHVTIVNSKGYWLKHPKAEMEWGCMLEHKRNIKDVYPASWEIIRNQEQGQFNTDKGTFTFTSVHISEELQLNRKRFHAGSSSPVKKEYVWKIVSHIPIDAITAEKTAILVSLSKIGSPIFVFLMILSYFLSITRVKNKKVEELLKRQATIDNLTGLPNRKLFLDRLEQAILSSNRTKISFALLFIDLDRFKAVNDTLGHTAGDQLLCDVSTRVQGIVRESDTVARIGGDEFTVILNHIEKNTDIIRIAQLLIETVSEPFVLEGKEATIGASIGIALFPKDGIDQATLIQNADSAMYQAKQEGRNRYCFFEYEKS